MISTSFSVFKQQIKSFFDKVENSEQPVLIKRKSGEEAILISLKEYNSLKETLYLLSSKANREALEQSIKQFEDGEIVKKPIFDTNL